MRGAWLDFGTVVGALDSDVQVGTVSTCTMRMRRLWQIRIGSAYVCMHVEFFARSDLPCVELVSRDVIHDGPTCARVGSGFIGKSKTDSDLDANSY